MKLRFINAFELNSVPRPQRKVAVLDMNELQWCSPNQVPAAGAGFCVYAGLPAGQSNAAGFDALPRRFQPGHIRDRFRKIPEIRKARTEAGGVNRVYRFHVALNDRFGLQAGMLRHPEQIKLQFVAAWDAV